jgi:protein O-GlcNAc transferase
MGKSRAPQVPKQLTQVPDSAPAKQVDQISGRVRRLVGEGARLLEAKRPGEAIVKLTEAWDLDPQNVAVAINLGGAYILQGKHECAIPVLEAASILEPDNVMVWSNLAAAYLGKLPLATSEHQEKAIEAYEQALALDTQAPHVHYNLGLIYLERDEPLRAASHFYSALETDPNDRDARYWLVKIQEGLETDRTPGVD